MSGAVEAVAPKEGDEAAEAQPRQERLLRRAVITEQSTAGRFGSSIQGKWKKPARLQRLVSLDSSRKVRPKAAQFQLVTAYNNTKIKRTKLECFLISFGLLEYGVTSLYYSNQYLTSRDVLPIHTHVLREYGQVW